MCTSTMKLTVISLESNMDEYIMNMVCDNCFAKSTKAFKKGTTCTHATFTSGDYYECPHCGCVKAKSTTLWIPDDEKEKKRKVKNETKTY